LIGRFLVESRLTTRGVWERAIAEIDGRLAKDTAVFVRAQPRTAIAVKKAEAEFTGVLIAPPFTGDPPGAHQHA